MSLRFAGKHCAIVGATGVIGSAIAKAFAREGAVISVLGRTALEARSKLEPQLYPYKLLDNSGDIQKDRPSTHQFVRLDVSNREDIKNVFGSRDDSVGPLDILVNCAGISQTTLLKRTPDEELANIVDTNLLATILVCCIINVSSLMAIKGGLGATAYAASKAGLVGFTRALCREMAARSIRVNALLPGWVDTPMWSGCGYTVPKLMYNSIKDLKPELQQAYLKDTPLNRVADPNEVAEAAVFLASNGYANNCVLNLDGGLSAA
ncbi:3-oxoacyl-[acyl-carrier-protein] reductase [Cladobotryum mycophilum]|uniref:3-oxoacyl-[acyl-carrier-protein] reductase n=1 Tax=Cladobotryum mycophilum TaxID=491253 RepID=A0ABR0SZQ3_9HYPO